jgi:hypothetical protein
MEETIQVLPKTMTDIDFVEAISLAMKADIGMSLRNRIVEELLTIRQRQKMAHAGLVAQFTPTPPNTTT